ncbi:MAG TPA: hypothetical protein VKV79_02440, partial [Terriglobia bacterium]|nr:hypothetical protein [Terriglobia bacterium]
PAQAWGRRAHEMITAAAFRDLPKPLRSYLRRYQFAIVDGASEPDELARGNPVEERHHFVNADAYGSFPFRQLQAQFVFKRLGPSAAEIRNGDVMWQIDRFTLRLASDFRYGRWKFVVHDAIFAAHYAADLAQPLHTVANYDGQHSGQRGIHRAFETRVVDFYADRWILHPAPAAQLRGLRAAIFGEFLKSYKLAPVVFAADREVRRRWQPGDPRYLPALARLLGPFTRDRLEDAACFVASLWYTAWRRAGSPDLQAIDETTKQHHRGGARSGSLLFDRHSGI